MVAFLYYEARTSKSELFRYTELFGFVFYFDYPYRIKAAESDQTVTLGGKFIKPISFILIFLCNHNIHTMLMWNPTAVTIKNSFFILAEQPIVVIHK